jgi:cellulose biosynthesis protein BcsQ
LINQAIVELQEQMLSAKATFGLAINGLQYQLWQRHGKICVPRTRLMDLTVKNIESVIKNIKNHLQHPRRALTAMLWNNKGGVGKSTLTANIATALAMDYDKKVLLINFDFQGDLNVIMGHTPMEQYNPPVTILDVLEDANIGLGKHSLKSLIRPCNYTTKAGFLHPSKQVCIDLVPGDMSMKLFEKGLDINGKNYQTKIDPRALMSAIMQSGLYDAYDYIFIDSAPSWEPTGRFASHAVDVVLPILDTSVLALKGAIRLKEQLLTNENFLDDDSTIPTIGQTILNCRSQSKEIVNSERDFIEKDLKQAQLPHQVSVVKNNGFIANAVRNKVPVVIDRNGTETKNIKEITKNLFIY